MKISCIYKIINTKNNKSYIGSTADFYGRVARHKGDLKNKQHKNPHLQNSYNLYGDVFKYIIYRYAEPKDLHRLERYFIEKYRPEYNIGRVGGGDVIKKHPNRCQIYKKMSEDRRGPKNANWRGGVSMYVCESCGTPKKNKNNRITICRPCINKIRKAKIP